jgi:hypothetical protein
LQLTTSCSQQLLSPSFQGKNTIRDIPFHPVELLESTFTIQEYLIGSLTTQFDTQLSFTTNSNRISTLCFFNVVCLDVVSRHHTLDPPIVRPVVIQHKLPSILHKCEGNQKLGLYRCPQLKCGRTCKKATLFHYVTAVYLTRRHWNPYVPNYLILKEH